MLECSMKSAVSCVRRVAKSTGASVVTTLADMEGTESFDASSLGQCDEVIAIAWSNFATCMVLLHSSLHLCFALVCRSANRPALHPSV